MRRSSWMFTIACTVLATACSDAVQPPTAVLAKGGGGGVVLAQQHTVHRVSMMDACDPTTFNEVIGEGTCTVRKGGITFEQFIGQLEAHGTVGSWHFAPSMVSARVGDEIMVINRGGEAHTFTEVAAFGGGFIPDLNALSGNPVPAPECLNVGALVFVPPGGTVTDEVNAAGTELYQCCLHPWMRATVTAR